MEKNPPVKVPAPCERPWFYFHAFLVCGLFLSYAPVPSAWKWGWGLPALALALGIYLRGTPPPRTWESPAYGLERFSIPSMAFAGLALLAVGLRFFALTSFFTYPLYDDVLNAFFALHLDLHWTWHPFFY